MDSTELQGEGMLSQLMEETPMSSQSYDGSFSSVGNYYQNSDRNVDSGENTQSPKGETAENQDQDSPENTEYNKNGMANHSSNQQHDPTGNIKHEDNTNNDEDNNNNKTGKHNDEHMDTGETEGNVNITDDNEPERNQNHESNGQPHQLGQPTSEQMQHMAAMPNMMDPHAMSAMHQFYPFGQIGMMQGMSPEQLAFFTGQSYGFLEQYYQQIQHPQASSTSASQLPATASSSSPPAPVQLHPPEQSQFPSFLTDKEYLRNVSESAMADAEPRSRRKASTSDKKCRYDNSLSLLTKKFVGLIAEAQDGVLDLNKAAETLHVQKRRIYDITNVLEGIGLIEKKSKNNIRWKGCGSALASSDSSHEVDSLKNDLTRLEDEHQHLSEQIQVVNDEIKKLAEDNENQKLAYVTYEDIRKSPGFKNELIVAVRAPPGTTLNVPDPEEGVAFPSERKFQIFLKSPGNPIQVLLLNDEEDQTAVSTNIGSSQADASAQESSSSVLELSPPQPDSFLFDMGSTGISDMYQDFELEGILKDTV